MTSRVTAATLFHAGDKVVKIMITYWLAEHRAEIIDWIAAAQTKPLHDLFDQLCARFPSAKGTIIVISGGTAEEAITAITEIDPQLGAGLKEYQPRFEEFITELRTRYAAEMEGTGGTRATT